MNFFKFIKTDILENIYLMFGYAYECEDPVDFYAIFVNTLIDRAPRHTLKLIYYLIEYHTECSKSDKPLQYECIYQYVYDFLEISYVEKQNEKLSITQTTAIEFSASISTNLILTAMKNAELLRQKKLFSMFQYVNSTC